MSSTPFISVRQLHKQYHLRQGLFGAGKTLHALSGLDFDVESGGTFGLVGESGSGKSTLARVLLGAEPASSGEVWVDGVLSSGLRGAQRRAFHRTVQPVLQDPYSSLSPMMRVGDIVSEPLRIHRLLKGPALQQRVQELLQWVGLAPELARRHPNQLSGGQRQRVAIARALGLQPRALILDEPVSALDVSIQAQILNLLADLQQAQGLTYVLISHDLAVVASMSTRIGVLYLGEFMELGGRDQVLGQPLHPYTRQLLDSSERRVEEASSAGVDTPSPVALPSGCRYQARCPQATERCRSERPSLRPAAPGHWVACHFAAPPAGGPAAAMSPPHHRS